MLQAGPAKGRPVGLIPPAGPALGAGAWPSVALAGACSTWGPRGPGLRGGQGAGSCGGAREGTQKGSRTGFYVINSVRVNSLVV